MSFRGIGEFVLHIEHFRNIDLFQQGLYFLKFQVFNEDAEKVLSSLFAKHHRSITQIPTTTRQRIRKRGTSLEQVSTDCKNLRSKTKQPLLSQRYSSSDMQRSQ